MSKEKKDINPILELSSNIMVLEDIADGIVKIAEAFKKMQSSQLKQNTIITLMHSMIGPTHITKKQIKAVLECGAKLDSHFLKSK